MCSSAKRLGRGGKACWFGLGWRPVHCKCSIEELHVFPTEFELGNEEVCIPSSVVGLEYQVLNNAIRMRKSIRLYHPCAAVESWTSGHCCLSSLVEFCSMVTLLPGYEYPIFGMLGSLILYHSGRLGNGNRRLTPFVLVAISLSSWVLFPSTTTILLCDDAELEMITNWKTRQLGKVFVFNKI